MKKLLVSKMQTPDGTILTSRNRHDFVCHEDKNGKLYCLDGGVDYQKISGDWQDLKDLSIYDDADFIVIRENLERGSYGKSGKEKLKYTSLKDMDEEHLNAVINYEKEYHPNNPILKYYTLEKQWRLDIKK